MRVEKARSSEVGMIIEVGAVTISSSLILVCDGTGQRRQTRQTAYKGVWWLRIQKRNQAAQSRLVNQLKST